MNAPTMLLQLADATSPAGVMRSFVAPVIKTLCVLASLVCVFFLVNGGIQYTTSSGKPEQLDNAKRIIRNALIGLVIVLGAGVLTAILMHAYAGSSAASSAKLPNLTAITPAPVSNGLVEILIKAITGLLNNIVQSVAAPFLKALSFFTTSTPLMADNASVFKLWLALVGITDVLFVLVVALLGFHVMGASTFGLDEIEFKHLLPRLTLIFLLINSSIFMIDGVIELSNVMIKAINSAGASKSVWDTLTDVVKHAGGQGVAALLIMVTFLIFSVILVVYYVGRLVTLYIGAVLSPLLLLLWLIPGFRDFSESAAKTYLTTIFVLFVHVVILEIAASLFVGMQPTPSSHGPDTLIAMAVGLATLYALLKTQGVMMQFSYASIGPRTARRLGGQFMTGVSYLGGAAKPVAVFAGAHSGNATLQKLSSPKARYKQGVTTLPASSLKDRSAILKAPKKVTGSTSVAPNSKQKPPKVMEKP